MSSDPLLRPFGDVEPEGGNQHAPHLADYWHVISRRIWLVLVILAVTTVSAVWAVSRQRTLYQSTLALQVSDPLSRTRSLVPVARVSGLDIFVDPMQSEIEVLRADTISEVVVDSLGLRLAPADPELARSALFVDQWVAREAPDAAYELVYDQGGSRVEFRRAGGPILSAGAVGSVLDAGFVRFTPQPPPHDARVYSLKILSRAAVAPEVANNIAATPRESTNIIDVTYTGIDPELAPHILNAAADALREYGARRVRAVAGREVRFIEERLDSARVQLSQSLQDIREFKQTERFTNLSFEEQGLVNQAQVIVDEMDDLERQRSTLAGLSRKIDDAGLEEGDLVTLTAILPAGANPQIQDILGRLQLREDQIQNLLTTERKTPDHPDARALQSQIEDVERELGGAMVANSRIIESRLESLNRQQQDIRVRQRAFPQLENELQTLELGQTTDFETYRFLLAQLYQAQITEAAATAYVDIIDRAGIATEIQPRGRTNVFLGALLGLVLGIAAAFFLEYLDRTVRTSHDVETLLGLLVLGVVPRLKRVGEASIAEPKRGAKTVPMIVALDPLDPAAEAYRNLRMNLMFMSSDESPIRTITFSSPGPDEGKSTTAVNFAVMVAQQGQRVLLVDADLRRPSLHRALDVLREPGLTNLLLGDAEERECIRPNVLPNLDFLPSGPFPPNPSELMTSKGMRRLLENFKGRYSHVIIDSPPILAVTDAALISSNADGLVLVLRSGETEQRAAERAVDQLRRIGVRLLGGVLNGVSATTSEESYYLQYYYSYQPTTEGGWERLRRGLGKVRFW